MAASESSDIALIQAQHARDILIGHNLTNPARVDPGEALQDKTRTLKLMMQRDWHEQIPC
jgi:hypothetical protein